MEEYKERIGILRLGLELIERCKDIEQAQYIAFSYLRNDDKLKEKK